MSRFVLNSVSADGLAPSGASQREQKHIFTFYVIPPHWKDIGSWNPSSWKARTGLFHIANTMAFDDVVTQGAGASADMILT